MKLIEKMESEVAGKVSVILDEAKAKAGEIESTAKGTIERLEREARLASDKRLTLEKAKKMAGVTQRFKSEEAELKQELVDKSFDQARGKLDDFCGSKDYDDLFARLATEAFRDLEVDVTMAVREGDKGRGETAAKKAKVKISVEESLRGHGGGLTLASAKGDVYIDNSLYTRLERSRIDGVMAAGQILFGAGPAPAAEAKSESKPKKKATKKKKASKKKAAEEKKD